MARQHDVKLALQPSQPGERRRRRRGPENVRGGSAASPQPDEERRTDQQHEPSPGSEIARQLVRPRRGVPPRERRQRARRVRLDPRRHRQRARRHRRDPIIPRREIVVGVPHLGEEERPRRVGHHEIVKHLRAGDPSVARRDAHPGFSRIGPETPRPADRRLRPERHIARPGHRHRYRDRLADATARRVERQVEREPLCGDGLIVRRPARGGQREHGDGHRVAMQRVPLLALENRKSDGHRVGNRGRRNHDSPGREREQRLVGDEQVHPFPTHLARRRDVGRHGPRVRPRALGRLKREDRRVSQTDAQLARKPRGGDHVELLADEHGIPGQDETERDPVVVRGRRGGRDEPARERRHRRREPGRRTVHGHGERRSRDLPGPLPHAHGPDHECAGTLGLEPQLACHGPDRSPHRFECHLRHLAGADDREAREAGQDQGHRLRRAGPRADGERQLVARRQASTIDSSRHIGWRALHGDQEPQRGGHQSFTPGSAGCRIRPVRSRRVFNSSWPIERRSCSA